MFQRVGRKSRGNNVGLLGSGPRASNTQGQMGLGMKRMLAGTARMGILGNAPVANTDNSMYQQTSYEQTSYEQGYDQTEDYSEYGMENNSMYVDQTARQGMYNVSQQRQGLMQAGNARQAMSRRTRIASNIQPVEEYYEGQVDNQNYVSGDSWGAGEEEVGWDYGEEQHSMGGSLLGTPRHVELAAGMRRTTMGQSGRGRGLLGQGNVAQRGSLLGQPMRGQGRGLLGQGNVARTPMLQRNQPLMVDRQTELLQKADLQIRLLQQEQQQTERMHKLRQQEEERQRAQEMHNLLETQKRALMLQQKESQMRRGDGLLGDRPVPREKVGIMQQRGNIPSLFEGREPGKSLLGKRPSAAVTRAAQASKRARQESQISRNRPVNKLRRPSPKREQKDRSNPRRSRFEPQDRSKPRDRKETEQEESRRSSGSHSSSRDHSHSSKHESKDEKVKKEVTEVTVRTEEIYDPSEPTGDIEEAKVGLRVEKTEDVQMMETDEPSKVYLELQGEDGIKTEDQEKEKQSETNLTVTVSKKGRSVNDSDSKKDSPPKEKKYKCNVCDVKCYDEESFSRHMNGVKHKKRMNVLTTTATQSSSLIAARKQAEEHLRQIEAKRSSGPNKAPPARKALESHCKVCNEMFTGAYKDHKAAPKHKAREDRSKAGCKVCNVTSFNTYRDFIKHLESDWHMKNKKKRGDQDEEPEDFGELVTLDTVGFEEETQNESPVKEKEDIPQPQEPLTTSTPKASVSSTVQKVEEVKTPVRQTIEEEDILREYDPNVAVGQRFVMPVSGFFCKLCHKFYNNESAAKGSHCQSQSHFEKYQKVVLAKMMSKSLSKEATAKKGIKQEKQTTQNKDHTSAYRKDVSQEMETSITKPVEDQKTLNQSENPVTDINNQSTIIVESGNKSTNGEDGNQDVTAYVTADEQTLNSLNSTAEAMDTSEHDTIEGDDEIRIEILGGKRDTSPGGPKARRGRRVKKRV